MLGALHGGSCPINGHLQLLGLYTLLFHVPPTDSVLSSADSVTHLFFAAFLLVATSSVNGSRNAFALLLTSRTGQRLSPASSIWL